ncbi:MAG: 5'-nucleotidase, lipoprotein e(P4) family [Bacteroidales bacterium]|nr:5'-nucleotidase, lipoprotein e(P4) family [Bacteroidales bacterium]
MKKYLILFIMLLGACSVFEQEEPAKTEHISAHPQTMATLYNHYAAEYRALAYQAFNMASDRVDRIKEERPDATKLGIVVDIDETLLDNSPHQALMIAKDSSYPYMWNEWCNMAAAKPVPGALAFLQYADKNGFHIFYVSNRKDKYTRLGTMKNLAGMGFPQLGENNILLRLERSDKNPHPSDKQARRDAITAGGYEIVLLIGDNLGDFYSDAEQCDERTKQVDAFMKEFGSRFIILPNAMYGNWPASIGISNESSMDSLLLEMTKIFE